MSGRGDTLRLPCLERGHGIGDVSLRELDPPLRTLAEIPPLRQRPDLDPEMASDLASGQIRLRAHDSDSFSD
jgi:hypothetical protein